MGLLSRITKWSSPAANLLLVADTDCTLGREITSHLDAVEMSYELANTHTKAKRPCVHFLDPEPLLRSSSKKLDAANQIVVNVCHSDLQNDKLIGRLRTISNLAIVADNSATSAELQHCGFDSVTTIGEGICPDDFEPAGIHRRLQARRKLKVPRDAQCYGVFEPLQESDQDFFVDVATEIHRQIGPVCLLLLGPKSELDRVLRTKGISVARTRPQTISELLTCYWALDTYLNISKIGDRRGTLRSWATGIAIASRPNAVADDILRDGLTAAVSEFTDAQSAAQDAIDLCRDEDFRHRCCERGLEEVQEFSWPTIAKQYANMYSTFLGSPAVESNLNHAI